MTMKRINLFAGIVGAVAGIAVGALAGMDDITFINDLSIANAAAKTNAYVIRGTVEGVVVKIEDCASAVRTNAVALTSADGQTIFSANVVGTCTNFYPIGVPLYDTSGVIINSQELSSGVTNRVYVGQPSASKVTCTVTGVTFPTLTNSVTVKVLYRN
jgi:hypothetical protein